MPKGQETRDFIIARAAPLFNQHGYSGASIADMMLATGLKSGRRRTKRGRTISAE